MLTDRVVEHHVQPLKQPVGGLRCDAVESNPSRDVLCDQPRRQVLERWDPNVPGPELVGHRSRPRALLAKRCDA